MSKSSRISRRKFLMIGGGVIVAAAAIGGGLYYLTQGRKEEVKVGFLAPLSGAYSMFGEDMLRNAEFVVDDWNEKGGLLGSPIQLLVRDSENNPEAGTRRAKELITTEGVNFLAGTMMSKYAVNEVVKEEKIPFMCGVAAMPPLRMKDTLSRYTWFVMAAPRMYALACAKYAFDNLGKTAYIIGNDYVWGRGCGEAMRDHYLENNGNIVGEDYAALGTTDFSAYLGKIQSSEPDVILGPVAGVSMISFIKQAKSFGILDEIPLMGTCNPCLTEAMGVSPEELENVYTGLQFYWDYPDAKDYVEKFMNKYDIPPDGFGYNIYAGMNNLFMAVERAGTTDSAKVNEEIGKLGTWNWGKGNSYFRDCDNQAIQSWQIAKGKDPTKVKSEWDRYEIVYTYSAEEVGQFLTSCEDLGY